MASDISKAQTHSRVLPERRLATRWLVGLQCHSRARLGLASSVCRAVVTKRIVQTGTCNSWQIQLLASCTVVTELVLCDTQLSHSFCPTRDQVAMTQKAMNCNRVALHESSASSSRGQWGSFYVWFFVCVIPRTYENCRTTPLKRNPSCNSSAQLGSKGYVDNTRTQEIPAAFHIADVQI